MYSVYTRLGDGEFLYVATRNELEEAVQLAEALNDNWPREYEVRDSQGNGVNIVQGRSMGPEHRSTPRIA